MNLNRLFGNNQDDAVLEREEIAKLLKTTPEALRAFEEAYRERTETYVPEDLMAMNAKQASAALKEIQKPENDVDLEEIMNRIVAELAAQTEVYRYDGEDASIVHAGSLRIGEKPVTQEELLVIPQELRPQLAGSLIFKHTKGDSYPMVLTMLQKSLAEKNPVKKQMFYHHFRQGLDILDLDPVLYEVLGKNPCSMGNWLPQLVEAVKKQSFFKIPKTTVIKVPLPILQLTRMDYMGLTRTTMEIVNRFCMKVFGLDESRDYFIKDGTHSSKFDFRNAHVHGAKEVREIGEYLLFITNQGISYANPLNVDAYGRPLSIYGMATTNEWVVREYIPSKEPAIYRGLPLRTEFRVFLDADTDEVIGISPYWEPETMKRRFEQEPDRDDPDMLHDSVIYRMQEETLMRRYKENKDLVWEKINDLLFDLDLTGQWSLDVMMDGSDFYLIDMAPANTSALLKCVPKEKLRNFEEDWIPSLPELK